VATAEGGTDGGSPRDGGADGSGDPGTDAPLDADLDGRGEPPFAECTFVSRLPFIAAPRAIVEVIAMPGSPVTCHCTFTYGLTVSRVLCGSFDAEAGITWSVDLCSTGSPVPPLPMLPAIFAVLAPTCSPTLFNATTFPASDWDALLAEQVIGHGGIVDAAVRDGAAR
jgi:hypothetical protein